MTTVLVTITAEGRTQTMSEAGLAMLLGLPPDVVVERIVRHLTLRSSPLPIPVHPCAHDPFALEEGGKGGKEHVRSNVGTTIVRSNVGTTINIFGDVRTGTFGEGEGVEGGIATRLLAERLATELDDRSSIAFYARLVTTHPADLLERILARTLAMPAERFTRSRAAYFVGIVHAIRERGEGARRRPRYA